MNNGKSLLPYLEGTYATHFDHVARILISQLPDTQIPRWPEDVA